MKAPRQGCVRTARGGAFCGRSDLRYLSALGPVSAPSWLEWPPALGSAAPPRSPCHSALPWAQPQAPPAPSSALPPVASVLLRSFQTQQGRCRPETQREKSRDLPCKHWASHSTGTSLRTREPGSGFEPRATCPRSRAFGRLPCGADALIPLDTQMLSKEEPVRKVSWASPGPTGGR